MSNLTNIKGLTEFENEVVKSPTPVLVDFWASWCGPCMMMTPVLEEVAAELEGKLKIVKIDTEEPENQDLVNKYQVSGIPNMKIFKDGSLIKELVGFRPKEMVIGELKSLLLS